MDTTEIATLTTTLLTPFLPYLLKGGEKAIEEAGKQVGGATWEKAKAVWAKLFPKVKEQPEALSAVENVASTPADEKAQKDLSAQLKELFDEDEALATQIANLTIYDSSVRSTASAERSSAFAGDISHSQVISGSNINMTGDGNIIGQHNYSSVTKVNVAGERVVLEDFNSLLKQLREILPEAGLDDKTRKSVEADIQSVEAEAQDTQPSLPIIETKLKGIESIITRVGAIGSAGATLMPMIQKAIAFAGRLFS